MNQPSADRLGTTEPRLMRSARPSARCALAATCVASLASLVLGPQAADAKPEADQTVMLEMTDGVKLATDIYFPDDGQERWPVRLIRTPYGRVHYGTEYGRRKVDGYVMVVQDMRGRFDSEGTDLAFIGSGWAGPPDGKETVAWILRQPWCNGKIGTEGASAMGITQCLLAAADPPEGIVAQYILVAAPSLYHHAAYPGGAIRASLVVGWLSGGGFDPANTWLNVQHPFYDAHWRGFDSIARAEKITLPAVHFGGWYDVFCQGTIDGFVSRHNHGGEGARGRQKLIMGPWGHGEGHGKPIGELEFPSNTRQWRCSGNEWFDYWLKGEDNGADKVPAVQYYTMGAVGEPDAPGNAWRAADNWPVPNAPTPVYLRAEGALTFDPPAPAEGEVSFAFDPVNPVPTRGGCLLSKWKEFGTGRDVRCGPFDQREIEQRPDVVTFTSEVLEKPIEVTGRVTAKLWIMSDRVDTDFAVKLCDVYPDGRSMNVVDGLMRCRYRKGFDRLALLEPGVPTEIEVDLWSTSMVFNKGHRIRVSVSSSNYPRWDVNVNTGWPGWPMGPVLPARNTILCDGRHPSCVVLPVVEE